MSISNLLTQKLMHATSAPSTFVTSWRSAAMAAVAAFGLAEITTGQALLALLSAGFAAFIAILPALLRERRARHVDDIAFLQGRIKLHTAQLALLRRSRHGVLAELDNAYARLRLIEAKADFYRLGFEPYQFKKNDDLVGEEDSVMIELSLSPDRFEK
jgi:hypothetical protein